jgi:Co/Zn/Cd efflux system component
MRRRSARCRPVPISFNEAIPIAVLGLAVNVASVLLLSGGGHHHDHGHSGAGHDHDHDQAHKFQTDAGPLTLEIFEDGVPPHFRLSFSGRALPADDITIETVRPDGARQVFPMTARAGYLDTNKTHEVKSTDGVYYEVSLVNARLAGHDRSPQIRVVTRSIS